MCLYEPIIKFSLGKQIIGYCPAVYLFFLPIKRDKKSKRCQLDKSHFLH